MNCLLIGMGEMACYQERCPQCGRVPPDRKDLSSKNIKQPEVLKKLTQKFSGKNKATLCNNLDQNSCFYGKFLILQACLV